ncbi:hypothetical protein QJS10_CPA02g00254 [Acorus calamus]|uniref:Uncharacterized protein n=1 Tax=Acorus calamus TaxID=4465 RepID=A0AAV9FB38_ACOCL|nr:hypothetical protein QJS10_CPA02g00254 [Acorus calamus]
MRRMCLLLSLALLFFCMVISAQGRPIREVSGHGFNSTMTHLMGRPKRSNVNVDVNSSKTHEDRHTKADLVGMDYLPWGLI